MKCDVCVDKYIQHDQTSTLKLWDIMMCYHGFSLDTKLNSRCLESRTRSDYAVRNQNAKPCKPGNPGKVKHYWNNSSQTNHCRSEHEDFSRTFKWLYCPESHYFGPHVCVCNSKSRINPLVLYLSPTQPLGKLWWRIEIASIQNETLKDETVRIRERSDADGALGNPLGDETAH